jgi:hypothetical protein
MVPGKRAQVDMNFILSSSRFDFWMGKTLGLCRGADCRAGNWPQGTIITKRCCKKMLVFGGAIREKSHSGAEETLFPKTQDAATTTKEEVDEQSPSASRDQKGRFHPQRGWKAG